MNNKLPTGILHDTGDGTAGTGKRLIEHPCHIANLLSGFPYSMILRDNYSQKLGWVDEEIFGGLIYVAAMQHKDIN